MVYRIYTEKKDGLSAEVSKLRSDVRTLLGINRLKDIRIINRYDIEDIDESLFEECRWKVFADPQTENAAASVEELAGPDADAFVFAVETLPGMPDRRAESAAQCVQMTGLCERPAVRYAKVYALYGSLMPADRDAVINYLIDPASERQASLDLPGTLKTGAAEPADEKVLEGFTAMTEAEMRGCISRMELSMDESDLACCVEFFRDSEHRDPTLTELRVIDAFRSERVRHTDMNTVIDSVTFSEPLLEKAYKDYLAARKELGKDDPVTLNDIATIAARFFRRQGRLEKLGESAEDGTCSVMINVEVDGENEPWLLFFGSAENNSLTETDPYAGAAACISLGVAGTLAGRGRAYSAMRLSGAADPLRPAVETVPGKLPQRVITTSAAAGASDMADQAGLCVGMADEIYHPGYAAKRLETCAVLAAAPSVDIRKEEPEPGDVVMLLGDGAQGGDAAAERRLIRFFGNTRIVRMIKKCASPAAAGLCVAMAGLAPGLEIDLDAVPGADKGAGSAELATGGTAEMMACVIAAGNERVFRLFAADENLRCEKVAVVTEAPRLVMKRAGAAVADIPAEFLAAGPVSRHTDIIPAAPKDWKTAGMYSEGSSFADGMRAVASGLNTCSRRGLMERFDPTAGTGSVLMPFGGANQITPVQAVVSRMPVDKGSTDDCSVMAWGGNPLIMSASPYHGAYLAVVESVSKLIAAGASPKDVYLSFRGFFASAQNDPARWGDPLAAMLGAFEAQMNLRIASIGGGASMDGSFEGIDVPPTFISYAFTMAKAGGIISPEFKKAGHSVVLLKPYAEEDSEGVGEGLPDPESLKKVWEKAAAMIASGDAVAAYAPGMGGMAEAVMKMSYGNGIGFSFEAADLSELFGCAYGSIILEVNDDFEIAGRGLEAELLGHTTKDHAIEFGAEKVSLAELLTLYEGKLESVFPAIAPGATGQVSNSAYKARSWPAPLYKRSEPKVLIPVFPGTNCEYDAARAIREAGASPEIMVVKNLTADDIKRSAEVFASALKEAQIVYIPGGIAGDGLCGPDGNIIAFFRIAQVAEGVTALLDKNEGLMCGTGSGFRALLRLGLIPSGKISETDENSPVLELNSIGSHRSRMVRVRIASNKSPWLRSYKVGSLYTLPVSCAAGRLIAPEETLRRLSVTGQIATQYADPEGNATSDIRFDPCGSMMAVEAMTSPDGRVLGRTGYAERTGSGLYGNLPGEHFSQMFVNAVKYFK